MWTFGRQLLGNIFVESLLLCLPIVHGITGPPKRFSGYSLPRVHRTLLNSTVALCLITKRAAIATRTATPGLGWLILARLSILGVDFRKKWSVGAARLPFLTAGLGSPHRSAVQPSEDVRHCARHVEQPAARKQDKRAVVETGECRYGVDRHGMILSIDIA